MNAKKKIVEKPEKPEKPETGVVLKKEGLNNKTKLAKVILKNAPTLIGAIPIIGNVISSVSQASINTITDYWDELASSRRQAEIDSFLSKLESRLASLEIKQEAKDYFEETIIFRFEDIQRKLFTEPGKGFDELLSSFVANALQKLSYPPRAKDLILSTLLSVDSVDMKIFTQLDTQFKSNVKDGNSYGVSFEDLNTLLNSSNIDSVMISRSIQRLESQDLISPLTNNSATLREALNQRQIMEGKKSPQNYSQGGFIVTAFGRRFLRFLSLSD